MSSSASVVLLTFEFPPFAGGVATYCERLARLLTAEGETVAIVAPRTDGDRIFDRLQPYPIRRFREVPTSIGRFFSRSLGLLASITRHRPAVLWAADWRTAVPVALAGALTRRPFAVTIYGTEILMAEGSALRAGLLRWVFSRAALVLAISYYSREVAQDFGVPRDRTVVIPLGTDVPVAEADTKAVERVLKRHGLEGRRVLLSLARLVPRKGHDIVLRALPKVVDQVPDAAYLIAGTGPDRPRLEALARKLGVAERVVFAGRVPEAEKAAYYRACDVFVLLSRREGYWVEGFGLVFLEAGAQERPVVGGRHGGVPEAVVEGSTGLLVEPEDVDEAARAIVRLLYDTQLARNFGRAGRQRVENEANWSRVAGETLECLRQIAHQDGR